MNTRNWNIRGLNAAEKHDAVRDKIEESGCAIICLQETKVQHFDMPFIKKFAPRRFDKFDFVPSDGASGGILVLWNSAIFLGHTIDKRSFGMTLSFTSQHHFSCWKMTVVYGPCREPSCTNFVQWLRSHNLADDEDWLFLGDSNF